jgi:hypothetical protein
LGPSTTKDTTTFAFSQEFDVSSKVISTALSSIKQAAEDLTSQSKSVMNSIVAGNLDLDNLKGNADSLDKSADDYANKVS